MATPITRTAACFSLLAADAKPQQLLLAGRFRARDGRPKKPSAGWLLNDEVAARVLELARGRGVDFVVDYEHQTVQAEDNGQPAPAAGWIDPAQIEWRPGAGLYAPIKWTEAARARIQADEYRYLSPVFRYRETTGEVVELLHFALTNTPALDLEQVAARFNSLALTQPEETEMKTTELAQTLGLKPDASETEIIAAAKDAQTATQTVVALRKSLTLKDEEDLDAAIAALKTAGGDKNKQQATGGETPDPTKHVPVAVVAELQKKVAALSARLDGGDREQLIEQGVADGKIIGEEMTKWAKTLEPAALKAYLDSATPIAALKGTQTGGQPPPGAGQKEGEVDPDELAQAAAKYQTEQAAAGVTVSTMDAVAHVLAERKSKGGK